jgi:hypothetical protein
MVATILKVLAASALLGFGFNASAQFCVPQQGAYINPNSGHREDAPRFYDREAGCYITHRPQNAGAANQVVVPGVVLNPPPAYWGAGHQHGQQQYGWGNWGPAPLALHQHRGLPPHCRLVEKPVWERISAGAGNALINAITGALGGQAIDRWRHTGHRWTEIGALSLGAMGFAQGAQPGMAVICQEQVLQPVAQAQQIAVPVQVVPAGVQPQQVVVPRNPCAHDPGTVQGVLNLPGHQLDGKTVCAKPGDTNISRWL